MRNGFLSIAVTSAAVFAYLASGGIQNAYAYRPAKIAADQAELKDGPSPDANTKSMLPRGTRLNTSDQATDGYYRVRSATDTGWVQESDIDFSGNPAPRTRHNRQETMDDEGRNSEKSSSSADHYWIAKAFGGMDFWSTTNLNNVIGSTGTNTGGGFGGELDYGLSPSIFVGLRIERISKSATGQAAANGVPGAGDTINVQVASTPIMAGLGWRALKGENFSLDLAAYLGEGIGTGVTATDQSASAPNVTSMSMSSFTYYIAADANWQVSQPFWLFAELGYRSLDTSSATPGTTGNGSQLFQNSSGLLQSFDVNLSGPVINLGVRINF